MNWKCLLGHRWKYSDTTWYIPFAKPVELYSKRVCKNCGLRQALEYVARTVYNLEKHWVEVEEDGDA